MSATIPTGLAVLAGHQFANLTTYRRSGAGVATTGWFWQSGERIYGIAGRFSG